MIVPPFAGAGIGKDPQGSKYSYNILDGKQRLESLMLFIGNERPQINIPLWKDRFFQKRIHSMGTLFAVLLDGEVTPSAPVKKALTLYQNESKTQTTHISRRTKRHDLFVQLIDAV